MDSAPELPKKFPCWCRAVYSWGGETKKDLGFIEGDLIECLNAGDGQWWMGRLRRDKRAVGMFPSNFVKVLDESFVPVTRGSSPMTGSLTSQTTAPKKEKSVFRKPFQAYSAVLPEKKKPDAPAPKPIRPISRAHESSSRRTSLQKEYKQTRMHQLRDGPSRQDSGRSYQSGATARDYSYVATPPHTSRENSLQGHMERTRSSNGHYSQQQTSSHSRQGSYQYPESPDSYAVGYQRHHQQQQSTSRRPSYTPSQHSYNESIEDVRMMPARAPSPSPPPPPPQHYSRAPSPVQYRGQEEPDDGPPPPPPPPHRVVHRSQAVEPERAPSPAMNGRYPIISRTPSPAPHSPGVGLTPSPLRDAMDDILDHLQDMSVEMSSRQEEQESPPVQANPINPWSPEAFEELRTNPRRKTASRAQTSMGLPGGDSFDDSRHGTDSGYGSQSSVDNWRERMESRLGAMKQEPGAEAFKSSSLQQRPTTSGGAARPVSAMDMSDLADASQRKLKSRKSAYELGKELVVGRKPTTKSVASSSSQATNAQSNASSQSNHTLMSGHSAGAFSATSAGSFARRKFGSIRRTNNRPMSVAGTRADELFDGPRPGSQMSGPSYHASHSSQQTRPQSALERPDWSGSVVGSGNPLGGLTQVSASAAPQLKSKRSGFLRKLVDSAKAGAASARNTIGSGSPEKDVRRKSILSGGGVAGISNKSLAEEMGLGGGADWMQVRRDVNRSNSLSGIERQERQERCEMMSQPVVRAVDDLDRAAEGEEGLDGMPIAEPMNFRAVNMQLVDKAARSVTSLPPTANAISLVQGYLCRQYRSDVQRLRAIFIWVSEKIACDEDIDDEVDTRRVIQSKRGCSEEVAVLVAEMCQAVGLHAEVVNGYLKPPGEVPDVDRVPRPNHWWNAVLVDGEWRIMDCSLASPTNPKRSQYSSASTHATDSWYFLIRPLEACYTHIPSYVAQQHIVPPIAPDTLLALPCACPAYFKHGLRMADYDTSLLFLNDLETMQLHISVPKDVELYAEVETRAYARDLDGDTYESGSTVKKRALAQAEWVDGAKRFTVKALLPGDEGQGRLLVYAGKKGLMHSIKDNPHGLALSLPMVHSGQNPRFDFFVRHPTPHAQRHDLYVAQPQCHKLACGHTFVFAVRQHPSSVPNGSGSGNNTTTNLLTSPTSSTFGTHSRHNTANLSGGGGGGGATSPLPFRPGSALSMSSSSASGSNYGLTAGSSAYSSNSSGYGGAGGSSSGSSVSSHSHSGGGVAAALVAGQKEKPAKLAVQSPSGKIMRMSRKHGESDLGDYGGGTWEAYIKVGERGTWRGLVLADRSARWCVFGEWECV